ncbi:hypothetical protein ElyMa_004468500 [Elysia marginata]|uniref:Uncharacterized protein n=1 Tax=Elysia marginata TaxID=1093978 RepID=A0AAV4HK98_9GAST|nr:hypothetical protein ElyMa_004468500 [Elysia marginata]
MIFCATSPLKRMKSIGEKIPDVHLKIDALLAREPIICRNTHAAFGCYYVIRYRLGDARSSSSSSLILVNPLYRDVCSPDDPCSHPQVGLGAVGPLPQERHLGSFCKALSV